VPRDLTVYHSIRRKEILGMELVRKEVAMLERR
jgi:hypothetical protein